MIENVIIENNIDFIYVHQFPCVLYILPAVFKTKTPYIAYLHSIIPKTCEWFMDTYDVYKILFPIYFEYASKIIAITNNVMKENELLFDQPKNKYMIINNSIDFSKFPDVKVTSLNYPYNRFLLFGRISKEKQDSIETAIKYYRYCKQKYNPNISMTVVGDGDILKFVKENNPDIFFKGEVVDIQSEIKNADVLLGVDRCALESVASKKPTVVCGYNKNISLITSKNIEQAVKENFNGSNLKNDLDELYKYKEEELINEINKNYQYISNRLSIKDNVFLDILPFNGQGNFKNLFDGLNDYSKKVCKLEKENKRLFDLTQKLYKDLKKSYDDIEQIKNNTLGIKIRNQYDKIKTRWRNKNGL